MRILLKDEIFINCGLGRGVKVVRNFEESISLLVVDDGNFENGTELTFADARRLRDALTEALGDEVAG